MGREVLIKAVAQTLPTYTMSCFKLPGTLCHEIEALIQKFFRGQRGDSRKINWIKWQELCKPKSQGGMGFKDLSLFNDAFLAKQTWRLLHDEHSLFYRVFKPKFFPDCSIMQAKAPSTASYAWKSIIRGREVIRKGAQWRIGDRQSVRIWGDRWILEKNNPMIISPILHGQADELFDDQHQRIWKDDILEHSFYEFEANLIRKIPLCKSQQQDVLIWPFTPDGDYSVKSGYKFLQNEVLQQQSSPSNTNTMKPMWTALWGLDVPGKIRNFLWRSCQNSLPTKDNLMPRKIITEDRCEQCKCHKEDVLHALYGCPKLDDMWRGKPNWIRVSLRQANCFTDLLGMILAEKNEPKLFGWWFGIFGIEGIILD